MKSSLPIPHPKTTLHLYRHLLRESSYLPPVARPHIDRLIKFRVRRLQCDDDPKRHIQYGHSKLRLLRAANGGDLLRMQRVLDHAFGRRGKRRRELWDQFMYSEPLQVEKPLFHPKRPASDVAAERNPDFLDRWDLDKLAAFLKSQASQTSATQRKNVSFTRPEKNIPAESIWGLPLVPELARGKLRRGWIQAAQKTFPPIPKTEWETLRDIVEGKAPKEVYCIPERRSVARARHGIEPDQDEWKWLPYAIKSVHGLRSQASRQNRLLSGIKDDDTPTGPPPVLGVHNFTPRAWRRMFLTLWEQCAYIEKGAEGKKWNIVWGRLQAHSRTPKSVLKFFDDAKAKDSRRKPQKQPRMPEKKPSEVLDEDHGKDGFFYKASRLFTDWLNRV
ncbi:hypothetical protein V8F06_008002 [Rhypophila decipiens]